MLVFFISVILYITPMLRGLQEAADGSVCFNNCNGHGECIDYSCHCFVGYHGDACDTSFINEASDRIIPILNAGHFNITNKKHLLQLVKKEKFVIVGFSSFECHKCIIAEKEYERITDSLENITFVRVDSVRLRTLAVEYAADELPALVIFKNGKHVNYKGYHSSEAILAFISKLRSPPVVQLDTAEDVMSFMVRKKDPHFSLSTVMAVGVFSDHKSIEEDEYHDFIDVAKSFHNNEDVYFGLVTKSTTANWFKVNKTIDRTPALMMAGEDDIIHSVNLDELFGSGEGITEWIASNSVPLVAKLTNQNFRLYEKIGKPMLLLFLNLTLEHVSAEPGRIVGGKTGGLLNEALLDEFRHVAREHSDRLAFTYLDGIEQADRMRALGLYGGAERLPSLAFNTKDNLQIPFPEELPINRDTLLQFCADFISGKLRSASDAKEMAKKALQAAIPINMKNKAIRQAKRQAPPRVTGISEQFGDGSIGDRYVVKVTRENFNAAVMQEDKDVVLLLHSKGCEACSHLAVYFKRMAERFADLRLGSLLIARMDVTDESPPDDLHLLVDPLPVLVILPAYAKHSPWSFYSGVGKVQDMMKWVHQQAGVPFELPNLPHLTPEQRVLYKTQIREREEYLEKKRMEEEAAMKAEDRARELVERRRKKREQEVTATAVNEKEQISVENENVEPRGADFGGNTEGDAEENKPRMKSQRALDRAAKRRQDYEDNLRRRSIDLGEYHDEF